MRYADKEELEECNYFLNLAKEIAKQATCLRSKCGTIIVKNKEVIGYGFNSPPANNENQRRYNCDKSKYNLKITDKTCCIHAEQRAIIDTIKTNSNKINGSRLYFVRLDKDGNIKPSDQPYCTICSKLALDSGIGEFVLVHVEGITIYDTNEYNKLSFDYNQ